MASVSAKGRAGELRIGGRVAAELGPWDAERGPGGWHGYAPVRHANPVLLAAGATFELRLFVGSRIWRWRTVTVDGEESISFRTQGEREIIEGALGA